MFRRRHTLTTALLLLPALAGCGGGESDSGSAPDSTSQGSYGDTQQTSWATDSGGTATLDLMVAEPRQGSVDDFSDIDVSSSGVDLTGKTPYYVDMSYEVVDGEPWQANSLPSLSVIDTEGDPAQELFLTGSQEFEPCPPQPLKPQRVQAGDTVEGCVVVVVEEGLEPGVTWFYPADDGDETLTWE